jgi:hypothetical protein
MNRKLKAFFISLLILSGSIAYGQTTPYPTIENFTAHRAGDAVVLNWTISPGMTCATVYVMHSTDSINFTPIFEYPGICGPNAVSESHSFTDESPESAKNYYRMDIGNETGARIIPVYMILFGNDGVSITTNENGGNIHFYNPANVLYTLNIYSIDGKLCYNEEKINSDTIPLPAISTAGLLIFHLAGEDGTVYTGKYFNNR